MKKITTLAVGSLLFSTLSFSAIASEENCAKPSEAQVAALFERWNDSLKTQDPDKVVANYGKGAVLLPTVSDEMRTTPAGIRDYFVHFLEIKPTGNIDKRVISANCDTAIDSGLYTFNAVQEGKPVQVHARYTFVYKKEGNDWLIASHHSSRMPEAACAH